jgi:outer membrane receptor protein involved in Fe transport
MSMAQAVPAVCAAAFLAAGAATGTILGGIRGVVHDPSHRPVAGALIVLSADGSAYSQSARTNETGEFRFAAVPAGKYKVRIAHPGFAEEREPVVIVSGAEPVLHFQLRLAGQTATVEVSEQAEAVNATSTPETLVTHTDIQRTPGADLTNSLAMITDFVPGAYMAHDQLHVRGGHQVTWAIDGVPIPNTNIASNVGPQIDPKDIDYLEVQRGGYSSEYGDRTYGVFNVVPRTGFERNGDIEVNTTYGTFHQTDDQISLGDHTTRFAYFASIDGNRSDYGLETPGPAVAHDRVWGLGGFGSIIFNPDAANQLRFVGSLRRDDYQVPSGTDARDMERERDGLAAFTWVHTISPRALLTLAPFLHDNRANYDGDPNAPPAATQHRGSTYGGLQAAWSDVTSRHDAQIGVYGFAQRDDELAGVLAQGGPGILQRKISTGHLEAGFLEDQVKATGWLTLTGGVRLTHFSGAISENAVSPRAGAALRIPRLNWVLRGFYGRYYQEPPLSTVAGPLLAYAATEGFGFIPLRGERDEEFQAGLTIPLRGWSFDLNRFRQRARNYFDHNAIGDSNVFFPLTIAGARLQGWEFTARSPRLFRRVGVSVSYACLHADGEGAVTGGLTDFAPPESGYFPLDHDQRHTLHANFDGTLPWRMWAAGGVYYGSGFTDGNSPVPGAHLPGHTTFDLSIGKDIRENLSVALVGLNVANRRFLLDNSATFGGTHYADPRQVYVSVRYRFRY